MKIQDVQQSAMGSRLQPISDDKRIAVESPQEFRRQLSSLNQDQYLAHVSGLIDKIGEQGKLVAKRADMKELQKYRQMVSELLNETVSNSYAFSKSGTFDAHGRHRVFASIKQINSTLDEMTGEVLKDEADNLKLLDMVDDIRGMLVDMFL